MRQIPFSLLLSAAALLGSSCVSAQTLTIDNVSTSLQNIQGQSSVVIDPATGNVTVKSSSGSACSATSPNPTVSVTGQTSAQSAQSLTINWSSTNTAGSTPCTPSSNPANASWNQGASAASGSRSVTMPTVGSGSTTQQLTMTCSGGSGSTPQSSTLNITVSAGVVQGCEGTPTDNLIISGFPASWEDVWAGGVFPNPTGNARGVAIPAGQVATIRFTTSSGAVNPNGQIETAEQSGQNGGPLRISISRCQGDFRESLRTGQLCASNGANNQQSIVFATGAPTGANYCAVTAQTQYYLNITHRVIFIPSSSPGGPVSASECNGSSCSTLVVSRTLTAQEEINLGLPPSQ